MPNLSGFYNSKSSANGGHLGGRKMLFLGIGLGASPHNLGDGYCLGPIVPSLWFKTATGDRAYVMGYLGLLEIKPGDSVLETSVGTGLNFQYLPRGIKGAGVDLSAEMLVNCQANLRRWEMDADLFLGNAESL